MSKVLIDRELLAGLVSNDRETQLDAERRMYGVLANQPAEAEGVEEFDASCLDEWLRQHCHNDGSPGFVFAYEAKGAGQLVDRIRTALSAVTAERDRLDMECGRLLEGKVQDAETIFVLEAERDQLRAEVERLRKALEQFADNGNWCYDTCNISRCVAKDALVAKGETP